MRGRKPIPTELKRLAGNPGKRKLPKAAAEPQYKVEVPDPPARFVGDAMEEWLRVVKALTDAGIIATVYRSALEMLCDSYARYCDAVKQIEETGGEVVKSPAGFPVQNPFASVRNKAFEQYKAMLSEFGLTASSKTRIKMGDTAGKGSKLRDFLAKNKSK